MSISIGITLGCYFLTISLLNHYGVKLWMLYNKSFRIKRDGVIKFWPILFGLSYDWIC
jgi:hypothetical protein